MLLEDSDLVLLSFNDHRGQSALSPATRAIAIAPSWCGIIIAANVDVGDLVDAPVRNPELALRQSEP